MKTKISIIGAGRVGSAIAYTLAHRKVADEIVLLDIMKDMLEGQTLDIAQSLAWGSTTRVFSGSYDDIKDSRIVIICAGVGRKPGMTRQDLAATNASIIRGVAASVKQHAPNAIIITMTNPVDVINYVVWKTTGFQRDRVIGQGGVLDSLRLRWVIANAMKVDPSAVEAYVLGEHGDSKVIAFSKVLVKGKPPKLSIGEKIKIGDELEASNEAIISKKGATEFAPAQAVLRMVESIIGDRKDVLPCSVVLRDEYGLGDVSIGVPVVLGRNGVEKVHEWALDPPEMTGLKRSAEIIKDMQSKV